MYTKQDSLELLRQAALDLELARASRDAAIITARAEGWAWADIADAAGLTVQGAFKINKREGH